MGETRLFNDGWRFSKQPVGTTWEEIPDKEQAFAPVDLPHDWLIYNTADLYENSVGWYRKSFWWNKKEEERVSIRFDGVYMNSTVYVNGTVIGEWKYGYSAFEFDITDALTEGENEIRVRVIHESPNSRWYSGAGIYRNVWLVTKAADHILSDGVYLSVKETENGFILTASTEVYSRKAAVLQHTLIEPDTQKPVLVSSCPVTGGEAMQVLTQEMEVASPKRWEIESPYFYQLKTELIVDGKSVQAESNPVGFRTIELHPDRGFFLNGTHVKLNGVCEHHDLGCLGSAFNKTAMRRKITKLQKMGVNAIRTSHNMPAKELMELADEMGMLIVSEAFDMWESAKTKYDYARFFPEWYQKDVASWIRRDRNHPSVIMWSIGNEIHDTHVSERGQEVTRMLMEEVQKHDPNQNAVVTIGSNYMPWENAQKCADIVKVAGYNYSEKYYEGHHKAHPDWVIYGSETSSVVQSRGIYHFPYQQSVLADDDEQCSALGNSTTSWGAKSPEHCIRAERDMPFSCGQFLWTGFDYIGEPTPYHTKNSYFGQLDTAGFEKDSYYIYQAEWTDYRKNPMVHVFPYWDFNENQLIDVRVCSNAPYIELFLNGESRGSFAIDHAHGTQLVGHWQIPYAEGELKAVAYDENKNVIAQETRHSFRDAARVTAKADKTELRADGEDLIFVEIGMEDADGYPVENANNRVHVSVSGAGRLVGLDNGDSTDYDPYKGCSRRLFSGKLLAVIAAKTAPGEIRVEVTGEGVKAAVLTLQAIQAAVREGISAHTENREMPRITGNIGKETDIPVRKIEIVCEAGNRLDETCSQVKVRAKLWPQNATDQEVIWAVVNDAGIESNLAKVEANGKEAVVTAVGDGSFRLRCMSKNGTDHIRLISQLDFTATGLGQAYLDPYGFISGGLYKYSKGNPTNGNEKGVATARDSETQVGYPDIDFGSYGSDEITMPIFALSDEPYYIQIWEGIPEAAGSELVGDVVYQKPSRWNVYQEETYKLKKRIKGISCISFVLKNQKIHLKGFSFRKINKAWEVLQAAECDHVYGDQFTVTANGVDRIGNNVTLEFEEMDFEEKGMTGLVICGNAPIKNSVHVRFSGEAGESKQLVEFEQSDGVCERTFALEKVTGRQKVSFVFLPGSDFDFKWFRFF